MNTLTAVTTFNIVADNIGSAILDSVSFSSDQVLYNFEDFTFAKDEETTVYIYPADVSRVTILKDLYKNIVEWHITVVYKEERKNSDDDEAYDLRENLLSSINIIQGQIVEDTSLDGICRSAEMQSMVFEGLQSPADNLAVGRMFLNTVFFTSN